MKNLKADLKTGDYKRVYLLYGSEQYLKRLYRNKLKQGILAKADEINFSYFEGKGIDEAEVIHIAETMPFFAEKRLVLIENSGWFKSQGKMADIIKTLPDTAILIFVEQDADKRNRLYKAVKEIGYICEMNVPEERDLKLWIASLLKANGKKITENTLLYFIDVVGTNMENIQSEVDKISNYACDREVITKEDVDTICTAQVTGKIFQMIDYVASRSPAPALALYHNLLLLKEKPMYILYLITRQFNILMQVKQMGEAGISNAVIAKNAGIPPFAVSKYVTQARAFSKEVLFHAVEFGLETEEQVKTGLLDEQIAVEIMIVKFAVL